LKYGIKWKRSVILSTGHLFSRPGSRRAFRDEQGANQKPNP
jgi:hypothetical protein